VTVTRVGIIGMGGFARAHHRAVLDLERRGQCRFVTTCDPDPSAHRELAADLGFSERGVSVYDSYREMLDDERERLDVVTVPAPLPLHAEMHRACVERGLAVYLEKPPTLDYAELDEILLVEARAERLTNVGFNYIVETPRQQLKRRLLDGGFGQVQQVCFHGLWPRSTAYYARTNCAGRLRLGARLMGRPRFGGDLDSMDGISESR